MRLYTIQPEEVLEQLNEGETFICDKTKSEFLEDNELNRNFINGYNWLVKQMNEKIHNDKNIEYPIWAWYKRDGKNECPSLNDIGFGYGKECVIMELEVPDSEVVLSDFDKWHFVLNDYPVVENDEEEINIENLTQEEKEKTWEKIFEIENSDYIQATFWELNRDMIINVEKFFPNSIDLEYVVEELTNSEEREEIKEYINKNLGLSINEWANNYIENEIKTKQIRLKNQTQEKTIDDLIKKDCVSIETIEKVRKLTDLLEDRKEKER